MKSSVLCAGCLLFSAVPGAVQNVTITAENAYDYSDENKLICDSGSIISVEHSYRLDGKTLRAALLDFIEVVPPAAGDPEPWVSIRLKGPGLTNDVDFSAQPYLWLGSPADERRDMSGVYEPYGDVYRFGYAGGQNGEFRGLVVTNLVDNPVTGAPRSVLVRGEGNAAFVATACSYTGGMVVEGPARVCMNGDDFGAGAQANPLDFVTLRNVNGQPARLLFKNPDKVYATGFHIEGTNVFHSCGSSTKAVCTVFNGPITGEGCILLTDQGGVRFANTNNTFTGALVMESAHKQYDIEIGFGNGACASWAGNEIVQNDLTNNVIVVNCTNAFTLAAKLSANGGRLIKKGSGTLTLGAAFAREPFSGRPDIPVMQILAGTVTRTVEEPKAANGLVQIMPGSTLDLNQVPATSLWLPYGIGRIVNPPSGDLVFQGPAQPDTCFGGFVEGNGKVVLKETGGNYPWRLSSRAELPDGGLEIVSGTASVDTGFVSSSLALADRSTLRVESGDNLFGLELAVWFASSGWAGSGKAERMENAIAYANEHVDTPDFLGDMTTFGESFYSGSGDSVGGTTAGAFAKAFGSSRDCFIAKFTGFLKIEADGLYGFRAAGDDGVCVVLDRANTIINIAAGSHSTWGTKEDVPLTAGLHPITVYFYEETGWEVLYVQMKAPGGEWAYLPTSLLSVSGGLPASLGTVTGAGFIELADSDAVWPGMDLTDFQGWLIANEATAAETVGSVTPAASHIYFQDNNTDWWSCGTVLTRFEDGHLATDMGGLANSVNCLNRRTPLDLAQPFTASFDFSIHEPWGGSPGDGFCLMLHDKVTGTFGSVFSYGNSSDRIANKGAYGFQAYMMPTESRLCWVKDNRYLDTVTTNKIYVMNNAKDRAKPFHVTMSWDLETLVCTFAQEGRDPLTFANQAAAADLAEKFASGQAYWGLWVRNGDYYCTAHIENLAIVVGSGEATDPKTVTFNGVLGITNGTAQVAVAPDVSPVLASDLRVVGAGGLATMEDAAVLLAGDVWTFDLTNPASKLALSGSFTFPSDAVVTVELVGEPPRRARVLADLTELPAGTLDGVTFRLSEGSPGSWRLVQEAGLLKISAATGTAIILR
ncbi:MAG: hypothetical protein ACI4Q3_09980 [Kiritimatiellia bacterium]